ncbi:uncharacterized protein [Chiloscyllium punctatum]|uniref:uncharacterized protein n=1 Tax=Chiloscyllium punctatum TaxID=137246 RepID=UPI003B6404CC
MLKTLSFSDVSFLGILYVVSVCSSGDHGRNLAQTLARRGGNVLFRCPFPFHVNHSAVTAYWWRDGNKSFLQANGRKRFTVRRGGAYLHVLNVTVADAGMYHCAVKYQHRTVGKGTGLQLLVYAAPVPLKIVSTSFHKASSTFLRLQCQTAEFHPKEFNLTWHKNGTRILTGISTVQQETTDRLYEVISSLEETRPIEQGTVYTCQVYHVSISGPANCSYIVDNVDYHAVPVHLIYRSILGILVIIILAVIIFDHVTSDMLHRYRNEETKRNSVTIGKLEPCSECTPVGYDAL